LAIPLTFVTFVNSRRKKANFFLYLYKCSVPTLQVYTSDQFCRTRQSWKWYFLSRYGHQTVNSAV